VGHGGIIAAGEGSRLRAAGFARPKPLVTIGGIPLIELVVRNFVAAGIRSLTVIVNDEGRECRDVLRARFPTLDITCIVKSTPSSLESFREVAGARVPGRMLISTVDAVCRPADFTRFVAAATARPAASTVLAVTPLVADDKPLWVERRGDGRLVGIGGAAGNYVTAGFYLVSERVRRLPPPPEARRLRDFLGTLASGGELLYGEVIDRVVDVDRAEDVPLAELISREAGS
jgi:NDP-sugar pyrophosphorylase family protein